MEIANGGLQFITKRHKLVVTVVGEQTSDRKLRSRLDRKLRRRIGNYSPGSETTPPNGSETTSGRIGNYVSPDRKLHSLGSETTAEADRKLRQPGSETTQPGIGNYG